MMNHFLPIALSSSRHYALSAEDRVQTLATALRPVSAWSNVGYLRLEMWWWAARQHERLEATELI